MDLVYSYTIGAFLLVATIALLLALILGRWTSWPKRRVLWAAALPAPALAALLALWMFVDALISSDQRCGVDACGMAMMAAFVLLCISGVAFILSAITAHLGYRISKR